ncbi:hypothetical protein TIFTF001_038448, partial [Ficus carica]
HPWSLFCSLLAGPDWPDRSLATSPEPSAQRARAQPALRLRPAIACPARERGPDLVFRTGRSGRVQAGPENQRAKVLAGPDRDFPTGQAAQRTRAQPALRPRPAIACPARERGPDLVFQTGLTGTKVLADPDQNFPTSLTGPPVKKSSEQKILAGPNQVRRQPSACPVTSAREPNQHAPCARSSNKRVPSKPTTSTRPAPAHPSCAPFARPAPARPTSSTLAPCHHVPSQRAQSGPGFPDRPERSQSGLSRKPTSKGARWSGPGFPDRLDRSPGQAGPEIQRAFFARWSGPGFSLSA